MITLNEHTCLNDVDLTPEDFIFLIGYHSSHIKIQNQLSEKFTIKTNSYVGLIKLPSGESISIQPKVPINNLLYMISHTFDLVDFKYIDKKELETKQSIFEIYVIVLLNWVELLLKKGLYKSYQVYTENIPGIKGKFLIERNLIDKHCFSCSYDEITC